MSLIALLAGLALIQDPAHVGPPAAENPPVASAPQDPAEAVATLEDVVVERRRLEELVRGFVGEVGAAPRGRGLARWQEDLCVGVVNIRADIAQAIADRVSRVGTEVGLIPGDPGCRANVIIIFAEGGAALADALVDENRKAFRIGVGGLDRGNPGLRDFRTAERPVRWWHVSMPTDSETGLRAVRLPGDSDPTTGEPAAPVIYTSPSRIVSQIRDDLMKVMVIVDIDQIGAVNLPQLADYLAFVSLAQVDPDAEIASYDTILNLFDSPNLVDGMTDWDMSYLTSLYRVQNAPVRRINPSAQATVMAGDMLRNRRAAASAALTNRSDEDGDAD